MQRELSRWGVYEYCAEVDYRVAPSTGPSAVLRVTWRRIGARRWQSFIIEPHRWQPLNDVAEGIGPAIIEYEATHL